MNSTELLYVKHEVGGILIQNCLSWYGVGLIHWIQIAMDQHVYVNILEYQMQPYAPEYMLII